MLILVSNKNSNWASGALKVQQKYTQISIDLKIKKTKSLQDDIKAASLSYGSAVENNTWWLRQNTEAAQIYHS